MQNSLIIADAHVHLYDCFDMGRLLDSAYSHFQKEADKPGAGPPFTGILFLTETEPEERFRRLCHQTLGGPFRAGQWAFQSTEEGFSLSARLSEQKDIYLIAGRQIRTAENLEVLALGTIQNFEEGTPIEELIRNIGRSGAIPVIPWGVGKWIGRRGRLIKEILNKADLPPFFLGDNGNRPLFWPRPKFFKQAEEKGIWVLPGSDPLPFPSEFVRIGSFGFKVSGSIAPEHPGRDLKKLLLEPTFRPRNYGSLENPFRFFRNQLRMNIPVVR